MLHGRTSSLSLALTAATTALLVLLGISAIQRGDELGFSGQFAARQVIWAVLGGVVLLLFSRVPYRRLRSVSFPMYGLSLLLLVAVYYFPARNGARRWIPLGPLSFQPSELAKIVYILALSRYFMFRENHRTLYGLILPFLMTVVPVVLILKEPDLGTSLLFFPVLFAMLYAAGARRRHLCAAIIAGVMAAPGLWMCMSAEQKSRVTAVFLQQDGPEGGHGDGYHLHQSKQMLALGGTWGSAVSGMPVSDPVAYRLPAGRTGFVYCLVGEKWGLAGTLGVLILFGILISSGLSIASQTRDPFGRLLATGIVSLLAVQVMINTSMTVGLAPITGLTLPLMSYGGSSLLTTALAIGLLLNIGRNPGYDVAGQPFLFSERKGRFSWR